MLPPAGEVCSNGTRIFVQEPVREAFLAKFAARTAKLTIGDPLDMATEVGALINHNHLDKVMGYVEAGQREGAELVLGGERLSPSGVCEGGAFMSPAIFAGCKPACLHPTAPPPPCLRRRATPRFRHRMLQPRPRW